MAPMWHGYMQVAIVTVANGYGNYHSITMAWVGINSGPEDQGPGTRGPKGNTKSQNMDSFITTLHYRRLCCIVVQVSNTIFLSLKH